MLSYALAVFYQPIRLLGLHRVWFGFYHLIPNEHNLDLENMPSSLHSYWSETIQKMKKSWTLVIMVSSLITTWVLLVTRTQLVLIFWSQTFSRFPPDRQSLEQHLSPHVCNLGLYSFFCISRRKLHLRCEWGKLGPQWQVQGMEGRLTKSKHTVCRRILDMLGITTYLFSMVRSSLHSPRRGSHYLTI